MAEHDAATIAEQVWSRIGAQDWNGARELMHDDYVQEWPQSGERIEGSDDALAIDRNFPGGLPSMTVPPHDRLRATSRSRGRAHLR